MYQYALTMLCQQIRHILELKGRTKQLFGSLLLDITLRATLWKPLCAATVNYTCKMFIKQTNKHHLSLSALRITLISFITLLVLDFQVQIYNQYGQFVRKFGANILQHPRGVCVDNKGRIIVVECKVMRVIIFDQVTIRVPWLFDILLI